MVGIAGAILLALGGVLGVVSGLGQATQPSVQQGVIATVGGGEPGGGQGCLTNGVCGTFVQETGTVLRTGETISYVLLTETGPSGTTKTIVVVPSP